MNQKSFIKESAERLCDKLTQTAEWITFSYDLVPNGFIIKDDGEITQKYIFDFDKNIYTVFDKDGKNWIKWESFYIHKRIFDFDIQVDKEYYEINKPEKGDKKFFVNTVVDGYIDPETQEWMDKRSQEPDFDPWDDEFDFCDYQKEEICVLYAPDIKTIESWKKDWGDYEPCKRGFKLTDSEGNNAWIANIIPAAELSTIQITSKK